MIDPNTTPESEAILNHIERRIKRRLGVNILVTGALGSGKSYLGIRFLERWYERKFNEKFPISYVVDNLEEAIILIRDFTRKGEAIMIEEMSVLASSRDSLTRQNKLFTKFMDTARIKQVVVVMNAPHISFVDKHIILLSNVWIECLGVNFRKEIVVFKAKWLQFSQYKKEPYAHLFVNKEGYAIDIFYLKKPSKELCEAYDKLKNKSVAALYDEIAQRMNFERREQLKQLGMKFLTETQQLAYNLKLQGYTQLEISHKLKVSPSAVSQSLGEAMKKMRFNKIKDEIAKKSKEIKVQTTKDALIS